MYKTCYESCNDCTNFKNETSMNCKTNDNSYDNTYHKLSDVNTECHNIQQFQIIIIIIVVQINMKDVILDVKNVVHIQMIMIILFVLKKNVLRVMLM